MSNPWIDFVKTFAKKHRLSYAEALQEAKIPYKKLGGKARVKIPYSKLKKTGPKSRKGKVGGYITEEHIRQMKFRRAVLLGWIQGLEQDPVRGLWDMKQRLKDYDKEIARGQEERTERDKDSGFDQQV